MWVFDAFPMNFFVQNMFSVFFHAYSMHFYQKSLSDRYYTDKVFLQCGSFHVVSSFLLEQSILNKFCIWMTFLLCEFFYGSSNFVWLWISWSKLIFWLDREVSYLVKHKNNGRYSFEVWSWMVEGSNWATRQSCNEDYLKFFWGGGLLIMDSWFCSYFQGKR